MSIADKGIKAETGFKTIIQITPTKISSSKNFKELPLETRECKYQTENDKKDSLFQ